MGAAGLFLITFLLVHLGINSLLVFFDDPRYFNLAAHFMGTNLVIKVFEVILFGGFLLHIIYGIIVQVINWFSRPVGYKKTYDSQTSYFSKFMIHTAIITLVFLAIHLSDFYFRAKFFGEVAEVVYDGKHYHDLGQMVIAKFKIGGFVVFYIASFLFLGFHLVHGFQSAFQTLGLNHKTYTPIVKAAGLVYTVLVVSGFSAIPLIIYFSN
jgi:succinate dehydrogenase / fumarate reductase cytochrome b subunit